MIVDNISTICYNTDGVMLDNNQIYAWVDTVLVTNSSEITVSVAPETTKLSKFALTTPNPATVLNFDGSWLAFITADQIPTFVLNNDANILVKQVVKCPKIDSKGPITISSNDKMTYCLAFDTDTDKAKECARQHQAVIAQTIVKPAQIDLKTLNVYIVSQGLTISCDQFGPIALNVESFNDVACVPVNFNLTGADPEIQIVTKNIMCQLQTEKATTIGLLETSTENRIFYMGQVTTNYKLNIKKGVFGFPVIGNAQFLTEVIVEDFHLKVNNCRELYVAKDLFRVSIPDKTYTLEGFYRQSLKLHVVETEEGYSFPVTIDEDSSLKIEIHTNAEVNFKDTNATVPVAVINTNPTKPIWLVNPPPQTQFNSKEIFVIRNSSRFIWESSRGSEPELEPGQNYMVAISDQNPVLFNLENNNVVIRQMPTRQNFNLKVELNTTSGSYVIAEHTDITLSSEVTSLSIDVRLGSTLDIKEAFTGVLRSPPLSDYSKIHNTKITIVGGNELVFLDDAWLVDGKRIDSSNTLSFEDGPAVIRSETKKEISVSFNVYHDTKITIASELHVFMLLRAIDDANVTIIHRTPELTENLGVQGKYITVVHEYGTQYCLYPAGMDSSVCPDWTTPLVYPIALECNGDAWKIPYAQYTVIGSFMLPLSYIYDHPVTFRGTPGAHLHIDCKPNDPAKELTLINIDTFIPQQISLEKLTVRSSQINAPKGITINTLVTDFNTMDFWTNDKTSSLVLSGANQLSVTAVNIKTVIFTQAGWLLVNNTGSKVSIPHKDSYLILNQSSGDMITFIAEADSHPVKIILQGDAIINFDSSFNTKYTSKLPVAIDYRCHNVEIQAETLTLPKYIDVAGNSFGSISFTSKSTDVPTLLPHSVVPRSSDPLHPITEVDTETESVNTHKKPMYLDLSIGTIFTIASVIILVILILIVVYRQAVRRGRVNDGTELLNMDEDGIEETIDDQIQIPVELPEEDIDFKDEN